MTASTTGPHADRRHYDAVVVGSGWSGSLIAHHLGAQGWRVLVLEAGNGGTETWPGHLDSLETFYSAAVKAPNSPYRRNTAAPSPDVLDLTPEGLGFTAGGYFVQNGTAPYTTDYLRALGGAGMHWLGATPRMHPEDFATRRRFGYGVDWPITAADLEPFYARAERALGVAGDSEEQRRLGVVNDPRHQYPMQRIPPSHIDELCRRLDGTKVNDRVGGMDGRLRVTAMPQARNSTPNPLYDGGAGYRPVGAVGLPNYGERCVGNASCTPICPVQAKATPLRVQADFADSVTLATRCVVTRVLPGRGGTVRGVEYRAYGDPASPASEPFIVEADLVVLAGHAIENARLLLASGLANSSDLVGRNLMDHLTTLSWALAAPSDGPVGPFRGPGHTSGWECFRFGAARRRRAPFRIEIGNWGWLWSTGAPMSNVAAALGVGGAPDGGVQEEGLFGPALRAFLGSQIGRQLQLQLPVEQPADRSNRVTVDPRRYRDAMGNPRPVVTYGVDRHVRDGVAAAHLVAAKIFRLLGATVHTDFRPRGGVAPLGHFRHEVGSAVMDLACVGSGHSAGTHIMGESPGRSVVDHWQRTHDHPNLYAAGCGSMPSIGTGNPTLTMAALALRSAEEIHRDLASLHRAVAAGATAREKVAP